MPLIIGQQLFTLKKRRHHWFEFIRKRAEVEVRTFGPVVAIATGRLTGQIQPWGTRQGRKMSLSGDGCQGRGEEDPAHRMGRPLRLPPTRCVRNSAAELGGALRAGRSHCWRFTSLEVCPQSPQLKSGDNNQGIPSS